MKCLLLGNGLNRLSLQVSWEELLSRIVENMGLSRDAITTEQKPFSLFFEELCGRVPGAQVESRRLAKGAIANALESIGPAEIHSKYADLFDVILTTNYDYMLEMSIGLLPQEHGT